MKERRQTATSNFGVSVREGHDSAPFYQRFQAPELSTDDTVHGPFEIAEPCVVGDARDMSVIPDNSVALVVTSPPYFAGKQYEEELERDGIPASYLEYLEMLRDVFSECVRTLEPGGRIAVNVANLGRKPYRSLSADVIRILSDELGLLLRGELIWQKAEGASGNCAWGSFRSAANPVLRDISERVIIASKGRFDRAKSVKQREKLGLPHVSTVATEDFMSLTLDVWSMPPESAKRVGHPAPFPVELPEQLIRLYTYEDDLVVDPFMGSGSTLVAASRLNRRVIGYDLDADYVELARERLRASEQDAVTSTATVEGSNSTVPVDDSAPNGLTAEDVNSMSANKLAVHALEQAGFTITAENKRIRGTGVTVDFEVTDATGAVWHVLLGGANTTYRGGLLKTEVVWKTIGRASALRGVQKTAGVQLPIVVLTTALPGPKTEGAQALRAVGPDVFFDVIVASERADIDRLQHYGSTGVTTEPIPGFW